MVLLIDSSFSTIHEAGMLNIQKNINSMTGGHRAVYDMALKEVEKADKKISKAKDRRFNKRMIKDAI